MGEMSQSQVDDPHVLRIMVSTDNHLVCCPGPSASQVSRCTSVVAGGGGRNGRMAAVSVHRQDAVHASRDGWATVSALVLLSCSMG